MSRAGFAARHGTSGHLAVFSEVPLIVDTSALAIWKNTRSPRGIASAKPLRHGSSGHPQ